MKCLLQIIKSTFLTFTNQSANITDFGTNANPFEYRLSLFEISKKIVGGNYIFGLGYSPDTSFSIESDIFSYAPSIETSIDNAYLCMYIEGGLVAIMGWLFYYMFFIKKTYNNYKYNGNKLYIYILIIVFLYLINLFSVSRMGEIRLYAVIFGLSIKNLKKDYNVI